MSFSIEQPLSVWRRIDIPSVAGFMSASAGFVALIVAVNIRGMWGLATSSVDMLILVVWLSLSAWLSVWAFENAEGWWRVPAFFGAVVSVVGVAFLVVLAVMSLVSEHPDILTDDYKRKGRSNRRRRTRSSRRRPNAQEALAGAGLYVLLATASAVMLLTGWYVDLAAWVGEIVGDLFMSWFEKQFQ